MAKKDTANALRRKGISDPAIEKLIEVFNNQDEVKAATKEQLQTAGLNEKEMEEVYTAFAPKRAVKKATPIKKGASRKVEAEERPKQTFKMPEDKVEAPTNFEIKLTKMAEDMKIHHASQGHQHHSRSHRGHRRQRGGHQEDTQTLDTSVTWSIAWTRTSRLASSRRRASVNQVPR